MEFNEDAYWENRREEYEGTNRKPVAECESCGRDMYAGEECYIIDYKYYCPYCVQEETLQEYEPDFEED